MAGNPNIDEESAAAMRASAWAKGVLIRGYKQVAGEAPEADQKSGLEDAYAKDERWLAEAGALSTSQIHLTGAGSGKGAGTEGSDKNKKAAKRGDDGLYISALQAQIAELDAQIDWHNDQIEGLEQEIDDLEQLAALINSGQYDQDNPAHAALRARTGILEKDIKSGEAAPLIEYEIAGKQAEIDGHREQIDGLTRKRDQAIEAKDQLREAERTGLLDLEESAITFVTDSDQKTIRMARAEIDSRETLEALDAAEEFDDATKADLLTLRAREASSLATKISSPVGNLESFSPEGRFDLTQMPLTTSVAQGLDQDAQERPSLMAEFSAKAADQETAAREPEMGPVEEWTPGGSGPGNGVA